MDSMSVPTNSDQAGDQFLGFDFHQLVLDARSSRLGVTFAQIAWFHLLIFGFCEWLYLRGDRSAAHFLPLWALDVAFAVVVIRPRIALMVTLDSGRATWVWFRVGVTFAILCLTSASMNAITGFEIDWFKISWSMLGTFGFATLAWIFHLAFLIPAVQMSITALLIAAHPTYAYAIFGASWFLTLNGLGFLLEKTHLIHRAGWHSLRRDRVIFKRRSQEV